MLPLKSGQRRVAEAMRKSYNVNSKDKLEKRRFNNNTMIKIKMIIYVYYKLADKILGGCCNGKNTKI